MTLSVGILKSRIELLSITSNEILKGLILYYLYTEKVRNRCYTFVCCKTGVGTSYIRTNERKCLREMVNSLFMSGSNIKVKSANRRKASLQTPLPEKDLT